jgi:hypothetical protein
MTEMSKHVGRGQVAGDEGHTSCDTA